MALSRSRGGMTMILRYRAVVSAAFDIRRLAATETHPILRDAVCPDIQRASTPFGKLALVGILALAATLIFSRPIQAHWENDAIARYEAAAKKLLPCVTAIDRAYIERSI